jgi:hypothetical protein
MRNEDRTLTPAEAALVGTRTRQLTALVGKPVHLDYVKRDGLTGSATGTLERVTPNGSKGIALVDTTPTKGRPTSVNLYNVTRVTPL